MSSSPFHRTGSTQPTTPTGNSSPTAPWSGNVLCDKCSSTFTPHHVGDRDCQSEISISTGCSRGSSGFSSMDYEAGTFVSPSGQSTTSSNGVVTGNVRNDDSRSGPHRLSRSHGSGASYSEGPTSKSGEVGGVMVEFCDTIRSELGGSGLRGGIVRGMDSPTTRGLLLHVALHDHCGNHSLPYQSANIKTSNPSLSNMSNKGAEPVPAVGSDNAQNRTMQPSLHSYPKWESFCGDTGYSVVPLTGMHPVTSSPTWAAILHSRGLINFRASLSWESELPTTLILDTTPIRCNGPVAFVGKEDPDLGFVWVMEEVGDTGVAGKLVAVDELGTEEVLGQDAEEAARRVGWHLVREECEKSYWRN
ncbi:hypothetical protein L211DRAFT_871678 [Terfezia boudieri ATCC MYA-4762]|uniref:Uncharacterized protein n=1 Tax=Terfezia boudieri ATCC MYA-4762 TaxID=1051890 RepID=A0A3N4LDA0_9PEZI|nr:hypothetical protein L211DRAFT_871678 [Terfezia boudieri ATCC MYA-4762]